MGTTISKRKGTGMATMIRPAVAEDVPQILEFIRALAKYEREPDAVTATETDLLRDGFGPNPYYWCLIAEQEPDEILGAADYSKAGDRNAKLAAPEEAAREAARMILSDLTLQYLHDHPLTADDGHVDSVMRVNYDIDLAAF